VRTLKVSLIPLFLGAGLVLVSGRDLQARPIDAQKGKTYKLTKKHGPWMVMAASFSEPPPDRKGEGISPLEAANELVYELRMKGIPAYTFSQEDVVDEVQTADARDPQKVRTGKYVAMQGSVSVLAGNYESADEKIARKTRNFVKQYQPLFLEEEEATAGGGLLHKLKNGGLYRTAPGRPSPLAGAFLTINPLLSAGEIKARKSDSDKELLQFNKNDEYSLLHCKGKYTVVVASFYGRSKTQIANKLSEEQIEELKIDDNFMDERLNSAWQLVRALRQAKSLGYDRDYDAFVFHDKYNSLVTVGSFDSPDDPRIAKLQNHFGAKVAAVNDDGSPALGAEVFAIPKNPEPKTQRKTFIFDPYPRVMEVPSL
jgi:hypothetical protein